MIHAGRPEVAHDLVNPLAEHVGQADDTQRGAVASHTHGCGPRRLHLRHAGMQIVGAQGSGFKKPMAADDGHAGRDRGFSAESRQRAEAGALRKRDAGGSGAVNDGAADRVFRSCLK